VSDWGTRRQTTAAEPSGSWVRPESGAVVPGAPPGPVGPVGSASMPSSPWWSDALADPWRDPAAPAAVVVTPSTRPRSNRPTVPRSEACVEVSDSW
jgi:hypothetical protein